MAILKHNPTKPIIDLSGPKGNAFYLLGLAKRYGKQYGWETNAGYPTKGHRAAIAQLGITKHHRKSFRQLPGQMSRMDAS